ncbi:dipeptidyl peptidase IV [Rhodopirellula islandica]|uniref:Dipeptidyl peptidase IV n=1 Tax=Rhodopirellula islandica TaxID=595434 RepID=A0A0J1BB22_RHOIS|nr:DPP IV N-terminal domain-containing protein [Rhodopirellula islandica]KLU03701.1 dipeptidyl peptidase IV [Rhodopirellula islandica]
MHPCLKVVTQLSVAAFAFSLNMNAALAQSAVSQSISPAELLERSRPRLEGIYAKGEMRPKRFEANWLGDSTGFVIPEKDADSGESVRAIYSVESGERTVASPDVEIAERDPLLSPDGRSLLKKQRRSWVIRDLGSGESRPLLEPSKSGDISYQDPSWSPDGKRILFVEANSNDVQFRNVLVPDDPSYPSVSKTRFARVGTKIPELRVGVVSVDGDDAGSVTWLPIAFPEEGGYFGEVSWAGNSDEVLVERLSRFRDKREFLLAKVDGSVSTLFEETNDAWAVGSHGINSGITWLDGGKRFLFLSEKDGWRQAFTIARDGTDIQILTPGEYDIIDRAEPGDVVDEANGWYYFYASPENGTQRYLHRVPLDGSGTLEKITPGDQPGWHEYQFSPDRKWAFHTYSTVNTPPVVELVSIPEHRSIRILEDNQELQKLAQKTITRATEFVQLKLSEDVTVDASVTKPSDFDESKRYPVFVYVYGEPYLQTVLDRWGAAQIDFLRTIADLGYITVSIDNRGTPCPKGAAWRRSIFGSLGPLSTEEQAAAIQELGRTRSYVDLSRVGIWGWSGGGSNTLNALFRKPDVYHLGIAVVPKPQPHLYNAWFQEIYMRTPEVNADGYARSAPLGFADGLKGKLLIVTGSGETNTHIQIIEGLVDRLIELGKPFDYMVYPNRDHGLREGKGSEVHVRMLITRYLLENLTPGPMPVESN